MEATKIVVKTRVMSSFKILKVPALPLFSSFGWKRHKKCKIKFMGGKEKEIARVLIVCLGSTHLFSKLSYFPRVQRGNGNFGGMQQGQGHKEPKKTPKRDKASFLETGATGPLDAPPMAPIANAMVGRATNTKARDAKAIQNDRYFRVVDVVV